MLAITIVAGTCILGSRFVLLNQNPRIGLSLLFLGSGLWLLLIYSIFTALVIRTSKPGFAEAINGIWLLATVSTESLSGPGQPLSLTFSKLSRRACILRIGSFYAWRRILFNSHNFDFHAPVVLRAVA